MSSPAEIVSAFLRTWEKPGGFAECMPVYFTDATVYENIGMSKAVGIDECMAFANQFMEMSSNGTIRVDVLSAAVNGDVVMNERIDHIVGGDGTVLMSLPVMGIFVIKDGKILEWRDYFDTAGMFKQMAETGAATA